ncbi:hypothetical protein N7494_010412 [Penicillium frequentans]|uniref:Uncharacterized protein n=1 Tax=Penicillium frequentans TaxID=3151616 RepID=A0AAD6G936_9EURO|nr:hypothetical protein N7494_010412 [Penicillium glabrum]
MSTSTITASLPLTTTFTPPSACLSDLWLAQSSSGKWMNLGPANTTECLPSGWAASSTFSPGYKFNLPMAADPCSYRPSSWVFSTRPASTSDEPWYGTEICQFAPQTTIYYGYTWTTEGITTSTPSEMKPGGLINAYGLVIAWQETDNNDPATATATATATASTSRTTPTSNSDPATATATTETTTPALNPTFGSSGLSTGAKAGIGASVAVGAIMLLALLAFFLLRRRKKQQSVSVAASPPGHRIRHANPVEIDSAQSRGPELGSTPLYEADGQKQSPYHPWVVELDGTNDKHDRLWKE